MQYIDYMPKKIARRNVEYFSDEKNSLLSYVQKGEKYCMDHAVTATQKIILKAFDMDADQIQDKAVGLSRLLEKYAEEGK